MFSEQIMELAKQYVKTGKLPQVLDSMPMDVCMAFWACVRELEASYI